jgi:hypothetical protein
MRKLGGTITAMAVAVLLTASAAAQTVEPVKHVYHRTRAFDGTWSVTIFTINGPCPASLRYPVRIIDGLAAQAEPDPSYQVSGIVRSNGVISVTVSSGSQSASGYGRMTRTGGKGFWRTQDAQCSGAWTAGRRKS